MILKLGNMKIINTIYGGIYSIIFLLNGVGWVSKFFWDRVEERGDVMFIVERSDNKI